MANRLLMSPASSKKTIASGTDHSAAVAAAFHETAKGLRIYGPRYSSWLNSASSTWLGQFANLDLIPFAARGIHLRAEADRNATYHRIKAIGDFFGALILLAILFPLLFFCALAIKITSPGPIFFRQLRIGRMGEVFWIYKFRTMVKDADRVVIPLHGPMVKIKNDHRRTSIGGALRSYKIDELPQLLNVLLGDMSLVGPRPLSLEDSISIPNAYFRRFSVRPGLTGLWQANFQNTISSQKKLKLDCIYVRKMGLFLDLHLLVRTVGIVLRGEEEL